MKKLSWLLITFCVLLFVLYAMHPGSGFGMRQHTALEEMLYKGIRYTHAYIHEPGQSRLYDAAEVALQEVQEQSKKLDLNLADIAQQVHLIATAVKQSTMCTKGDCKDDATDRLTLAKEKLLQLPADDPTVQAAVWCLTEAAIAIGLRERKVATAQIFYKIAKETVCAQLPVANEAP